MLFHEKNTFDRGNCTGRKTIRPRARVALPRRPCPARPFVRCGNKKRPPANRARNAPRRPCDRRLAARKRIPAPIFALLHKMNMRSPCAPSSGALPPPLSFARRKPFFPCLPFISGGGLPKAGRKARGTRTIPIYDPPVSLRSAPSLTQGRARMERAKKNGDTPAVSFPPQKKTFPLVSPL